MLSSRKILVRVNWQGFPKYQTAGAAVRVQENFVAVG
jgi:hypothetical protein